MEGPSYDCDMYLVYFAEFVQVFSHSHLKMRVWERGAGMP